MKKLDLIPYYIAEQQWNKLPVVFKYDKEAPPRSPETPGCCPTCHAPAGMRGFVRLCYPIGHPLFGRPLCCPECWPPPFGDADGSLSDGAARIARMWERAT